MISRRQVLKLAVMGVLPVPSIKPKLYPTLEVFEAGFVKKMNDDGWQTLMGEYMICAGCNGTGELWTECCNGNNRCPCEGKEVYFGQCRICHGTGVSNTNIGIHNPNLDAIRAVAKIGNGFIGNPYERLR
jgi:hypothetical protein